VGGGSIFLEELFEGDMAEQNFYLLEVSEIIIKTQVTYTA